MTTAYTSFLPEVAPHVDGAPERVVINAIRNATIKFCEAGWVWIQELAGMNLVANQQDYTLAGFTVDATVAEILYAYYNGKQILPTARTTLEETTPNWKTQTGTTPMTFFGRDAGTIARLVPIPSVATVSPKQIVFSVALKPLRASTGVPDWIYEKYLTDIAHGALASLMLMPHKGWTNANLSGTHKALFEDAAAKARVQASKNFTRATNRNLSSGVARW